MNLEAVSSTLLAWLGIGATGLVLLTALGTLWFRWWLGTKLNRIITLLEQGQKKDEEAKP